MDICKHVVDLQSAPEALASVCQLQGPLPICSYCKIPLG